MSDLPNRTRGTILALGLIQGILLLVRHLLVELEIWNASEDMVWLMPWYAVALSVPTALALILTDVRDRRVWLIGLALAAVLALTGIYGGYRGEPSLDPSAAQFVFPYVLTTFIGWYVLLPFVQACLKTGKLRPAYPDLFEFAWNNGITLLIAAIFTGIFWGLLALWAGLFLVIDITLFTGLFYHEYFVYSVTATVFAFAIVLGRSHVSAVVTVRRIILAVFKGLLPLLAVISLLFLAALPFMGLQPLWKTGAGTGLMLTLQILVMIFLNAVFQNGQGEPPYAKWLRKLIQAAVVALPLYTALCIYGVSIRIGQHGWTVDRFWAALLTLIVGLHVVGYAVAAVRRSKGWMAGMAQVNIYIAAVVVTLSVAVNSPLLDPLRISTSSQVGKLLAGKVTAADFDFKYLRFDLGRHGNAALARLKAIEGHVESAPIRKSAELALNQTNRWGQELEKNLSTKQAAEHFSVFPKNARLENSFLEYVIGKNTAWPVKRCLERGQRCIVLMLDLNKDRRNEYIVFRYSSRWDHSGTVLTKSEKSWRHAGNLDIVTGTESGDFEKLHAKLAQGDYSTVDDPWQDLRIGGQLQRFKPE